MPSINIKALSNREMRTKVKLRTRKRSESKVDKLISLSLRCGETLRTLREGNLFKVNEKDILDLEFYFKDAPLGENSILEFLNISGTSFTLERIPILESILRLSFLRVREICLDRVSFDKFAFQRFVRSLKYSSSVVKLTMNRCRLKDSQLNLLYDITHFNPNLKAICLTENEFSPFGCKLLAVKRTYPTPSLLPALDLSSNALGMDSGQHIGALLKFNRNLVELNLSNNNLRPTGADHLASSFIFNHTLAHINLEGNNIGSDGCIRLSICLERNQGLQTLNLKLNNVGNRGIEALCNMLKVNHTLKHLYLGSNRLGPSSGRYIASMLLRNDRLVTLDLAENRLAEEGTAALASALQFNTTLASLNLNGNDIGSEGIATLTPMLATNNSLQLLDLTENRILDSSCFEALSASLKRNTSLKRVDITYNFNGWETVYKSILPTLVNNYLVNSEQPKLALLIFKYARILLLAQPGNSLDVLPSELIEFILKMLDPCGFLLPKHYKRIFRLAINKATLNPNFTSQSFLQFVFGASFKECYLEPTYNLNMT